MTVYFQTRPHWHRPARGGTAAMLAALAAGLAGCGGVSSSSNSAARVRAIDAAVNAGTANILVNNASANGDQQAFGQTSVSPYLYISGDRQSSFSYNTSVVPPTDVLPPTIPNLTLSNGQFYSVFLIGRVDVSPAKAAPGAKTTNDPRFLQVVVTKDSHDAPTGGSALVRVVDAAPDGGAVDVAVNGKTLASYSGLTFQEPTTDFLSAPYVNVSAGTLSVQVNQAGTTTPLFAPVSTAVSAGKTYTLIFTQPTVGTAATATGGTTTAPTFGLQTIQDNG